MHFEALEVDQRTGARGHRWRQGSARKRNQLHQRVLIHIHLYSLQMRVG